MQNRMNEPAAARYLKLPIQVLRRMRREKRAPTHIVINNRPYYDSVDLDRFIESVKVRMAYDFLERVKAKPEEVQK